MIYTTKYAPFSRRIIRLHQSIHTSINSSINTKDPTLGGSFPGMKGFLGKCVWRTTELFKIKAIMEESRYLFMGQSSLSSSAFNFPPSSTLINIVYFPNNNLTKILNSPTKYRKIFIFPDDFPIFAIILEIISILPINLWIHINFIDKIMNFPRWMKLISNSQISKWFSNQILEIFFQIIISTIIELISILPIN